MVKSIEGSSAVPSMANDSNRTLHSALAPRNPGSSSSIYEIIMISICGSMLLLALIHLAVKVLRNREKSCCAAKNPAINEVILENIIVKNNHCGKISTVDFFGPIYISYISEQSPGLTEPPVPKETFSSGVLPYFSFARSITPPDSPPLIQQQQ